MNYGGPNESDKKFRIDKRLKPKKKRVKFLKFLLKLLIILAVVAAIYWYIKRPHISINDAGGKLVPVASDEAPLKHITEPTFTLDLPGDWKELSRSSYPYKQITWKGTTKESDARTIDLYEDAIPFTLAVNRVLPVSGEDDRLAVDPASDNCITFSPDTAKLTPVEAAKMKDLPVAWQGVNFLCDIPNSLRNVVGTASKDGINKVNITGPTKGVHAYFLVYSDGSAHPDEKTFPDVLRSLRAL